ncbi:multidrug ABC transporter permease [Terrihabitans soli]|uniref:Multidrug ABC transporter permease n=1 Tax=Terrihabitans soli TaxID=708113 RepID=A0A6S6QQZ6_9HYPH|nr:ABC transporter ATP-binding protein [Terrihabitans soli]BCJ91469.1 multidrug ABC transporter permease [Terrihabitans soli]
MSRPKIATGARVFLLARLVANGLAQTALAIGIAVLTSLMLGILAGPFVPPKLAWPAAALFAGGLAMAALRTLQRRDAEALGLSYVREVQFLIFSHLCRAAPDSVRIGSTMTRFTTDLSSVKNWISQGLASSLVAAAALVAGFAALVFLDWRLAAASIIPFALCGLVAAAVSAPLMRTVRLSRRLRGKLSGRIGDNILVRTSLMHLGLVDRERRRMSERASKLDAVLIERAFLAGALRFSVEAIAPSAAALVLIFHMLGAGAEPLSAHAVASWLFALAIIIGPVRDCARAWDYRLAYAETARRIDRLLKTSPTSRAAPRAPRDIPIACGLRLDGVLLAGRARRIDFEAPAASLIALTGDASARSDLLGAISGLAQIRDGTILIGEIKLSEIEPRHFSRTVGLVSPAVPPLRGSLRRNLSRGIEPVEDEDLLAALRRCRLDTAFPEGLDTQLRAGAAGLPPGISTRIGLSRALLRDPRVLLVDDAVLLADRDGRAALAGIAAMRDRIVIVATDEPELFGEADLVWTLPDNPRLSDPQETALEDVLDD